MTWKGISGGVLAAASATVDADGIVRIPYYSYDGRLLRSRLVAPSGSRWWAADGEGVHLFGQETLPPPSSRFRDYVGVIVTEGESDCLAAREHLGALDFRVLACPGARAFRPEWRLVLEDFPCTYVVGDGDEAGRAFVRDVRQKVPWARPVVCPEGRDLRDVLQRDGIEPVLALLTEADANWRLKDAVLHAPDLKTARAWLEEP